ncbi:MAG: heparinase II/III family protein [Verrucomicrobiae bacterium]|nr:heparinase II/III family protein [Verrucomicrobiae bacterium]
MIGDDGAGWEVPDGFPAKGHRYYFIAAWRLYKFFVMFASRKAAEMTVEGVDFPMTAPDSLAVMYALTGNSRYAHKALVILNRLAQLYPTFDGVINIGVSSRMPYISWITAGEEEIVETCVSAYDLVFEHLARDEELVEFFRREGHEDMDNDGKVTHEDLRRNIAINLFGYMLEWIHRERRSSLNDWTLWEASHMALIGRLLENPRIVYEALEGQKGYRELMTRLLYNDGRFYYNSLYYNNHAPEWLAAIGFVLEGYCDGKRFKQPIHLFRDSSIPLERLVEFSSGVVCSGRIPGIGDQAVPRKRVTPEDAVKLFINQTRLIPHYPWLAERIGNPDLFIKELKSFSPLWQVKGSIGCAVPRPPQDAIWLTLAIPEIERLVKSASGQDMGSRLFTDTGLGILCTNHSGIRKLHAILNYGIGGCDHGHRDQLALNIIAFGRELTLNKGYPFTWSGSNKVPHWLFNTIAQNTVRIDGQCQHAPGTEVPVRDHAGKLHAYFDEDIAALVDGSCEPVYPNSAIHYRRSVFLIKDPDNPFIVDVFDVEGGTVRDYQFHAQADANGKQFEIRLGDGKTPKPVREIPAFVDSRFMYDIKTTQTRADLTARWWIGDEEDTGLAMTMMQGAKERTVIIAKGQAEGSDKSLPCDPHLVVRETGKGNSQFISVFFPYQGMVPNCQAERMKLMGVDGGSAAVGARITVGSRTYVVFHDLEGVKVHQFSYNGQCYNFQGIGGVILEEKGKMKTLVLSCGRIIGKGEAIFQTESAPEGAVVAINEEERSVEVAGFHLKRNGLKPWLLQWRKRPWSYWVANVEKIKRGMKLYLDTFSFKDRGKDFLIKIHDQVRCMQTTVITQDASGKWMLNGKRRK